MFVTGLSLVRQGFVRACLAPNKRNFHGRGELALLEYIAKTKPKKPYGSRIWYIVLKSLQVDGPGDSWTELKPGEKRFYEDCAELDRRRYRYEKNAWMTKLLSINLEDEPIKLPEVEHATIHNNSDLGAMRSIIELNKDLNPISPRAKRPPSAFSLFIKDCHLRDNKYTSFRADNLKRSAEAWSKLSEDEKQRYKEKSRDLRQSFKKEQSLSGDIKKDHTDIVSISNGLFRHSKLSSGPSRPSHLYRLRIPRVEDLYGRANKISVKERDKIWNSLPDTEKQPYIKEHESMVQDAANQKHMIKKKVAYLNELIDKAKKLERAKLLKR